MRSASFGLRSLKIRVAMLRHRMAGHPRDGQFVITIVTVSGRVRDVFPLHRRKVLNSAPRRKTFVGGKSDVALAWVDRWSLLTRAGR